MRVLFLDRSTRLDSVHDLKDRARGGMVSSLFLVTDYLSRMGHNVGVMASIREGGLTDFGTQWWGEDAFSEAYSQNWDALVFNRGVGGGAPEIKAKHRILWTHDLPHNGFIPDPTVMRAFSATVFMSRYAERVWRTMYRTIGKSYLIPNGVDKARFWPRANKDLDYLIYASAPNRGLKRLPLIFEAIKTRTREGVYMCAFSNLRKMHPNELAGNEGMDGFELHYKAVQESDVQLHDPVPQHMLAEELGRAGLMLMPTDYPEICSNVVLQSLASGTPVITTGGIGSVPEWVRHGKTGMLTDFQVPDYMVYQVQMVRNTLEVLNDPKRHKRMCEAAARTKILTWKEVAQKWHKMLKSL